ncbi:hypothetical protein SRHO_G00246910 [Serrasalmus rhombeus]
MRARSRNHAPVVQRQIGKDPGDPDHPQPIRNSGDLRPHAPTATACTPQRTKDGGPRRSAHRQRASDRRARGNEQPTPPAGQHPQHEPSMRPPRPQAPETGRPPAGTPPCQRGPNHPQDTTAKGAGQGPRQDVQPCTQGPPGHPYPGGGAESASSGERWGGVTPAHHHVPPMSRLSRVESVKLLQGSECDHVFCKSSSVLLRPVDLPAPVPPGELQLVSLQPPPELLIVSTISDCFLRRKDESSVKMVSVYFIATSAEDCQKRGT